MLSRKPDMNLIPNYIVYWINNDGAHYFDIKRQKTFKSRYDINKMYGANNVQYIGRNGDIRCLYIKYHPNKNVDGKYDGLVEFAYCTASTRTTAPRNWEKKESYYMDSDKRIYTYDFDKKKFVLRWTKTTNVGAPNTVFGYYGVRNGKQFMKMYTRLVDGYVIKASLEQFKKWIGDDKFYLRNGREVKLNSRYSLIEWYETSGKVDANSKVEKLISNLSDYELPEIDLSKYKPKKEVPFTSSYYSGRNQLSSFVLYQKVDEEWGVLRCYSIPYNYNYNSMTRECEYIYEESPQEKWRIYFNYDGKETRCVAVDRNGKLSQKSISSLSGWSGTKCYFANPEAIENERRIGFLKDVIDDICNDGRCGIVIANMLRYPEIEQLFKMGYIKSAMDYGSSRTLQADLKNLFGSLYNKKGKNLKDKSGLSTPWLKLYLDVFSPDARDDRDRYSSNYLEGKTYLFKTYKAIWGDEVPDKDTFVQRLRTISGLYNGYYWYRGDNRFDDPYYILREMVSAITGLSYSEIQNMSNENKDKIKKFLNTVMRLSNKNNTVLQMAKDSIGTYSSLNAKPEIDWMWDSASDVVRTHDVLTELMNAQRAEQRRIYDMEEAERAKALDEKRAKIDEKRKKYEYEDEDYIIRLPKNGQEIISEGSIQRICIGGYVNRHADGSTNLFFLRKKEEEGVPFYAIEVDNSKRVVQIHGYCNRWLGCEPDAIPTVIRWLRENEIYCSDDILTCKATGYGRVSDYVEMPVVDGKKGI